MRDVGDKVTAHTFQLTQFGQVLDGNSEVRVGLLYRSMLNLSTLLVRSMFKRCDRDFPGSSGMSFDKLAPAWFPALYALLHKLQNGLVLYELIQLNNRHW